MSNPNLIRNGNFNLGDHDFTSTFHYVHPSAKYTTAVMDYTVLQNPGTQFANGYDKFGDHTDGTGRMLFVDGTNSGSFWSETPTLAAHTTYSFSYYVTGADPYSPARVLLSLNGSLIDNFQVTGAGGGSQWQKVTASFTTGAAGAYTLSMSDLNNATIGNDIDIDDISLRVATRPTTPGKNLIRDGNFSAAKPGFTSDYTYDAPNAGIQTGVEQYSIVTNPGTAFTNGYDSYGDHTTGSGAMLFCDGYSSGSFWRESATLAANTTYTFSYFATGADGTSLPAIGLTLNGSAIDGGFQVTADGGGSGWQKVEESFTTTSAGAYTLALYDNNGNVEGNDFTIDDIRLVQAPSTTAAAVSAGSTQLIQAAAGFGASGAALSAGQGFHSHPQAWALAVLVKAR